uniref:CSON012226 protein n=1 Tax=Culicoides sonorensis TaxID=179676 RepID=A0A336M514_CULSO
MGRITFVLFLLSFVFVCQSKWVNELPECDVPSGTKFPEGFKFGAASAAYQIEGAWDADGKGENIWDWGTHTYPERIFDRSNGDVAANSYNLYQEDVKALRDVGFNFYRFSISWARILPTGELPSLNQKGLDYYHRLIDALLANGIQPVVTMYHWDLPQTLQLFGGFSNPLIVDYFETYADVLFKNFGDKVKIWHTFNEPFEICVPCYENGEKPPFLKAKGTGGYLCTHYLLLSHARVYHMYQKKYKPTQNGRIGIVLSGGGGLMRTNTTQAKEAVERKHEFTIGWYAHPIFTKEGNYPKIMIESVANNSLAEGFEKSRLPEFTKEEIDLLRGSADFLGLNYYTSRVVDLGSPNVNDPPSYQKDFNIVEDVDPSWPRAKSEWLYSSPEGFRVLMDWMNKQYNTELWITENGWSDDGPLYDIDRVVYYQEHLKTVMQAIKCDNVNLTVYTAWSIIDNFEWMMGYSERFGLYHINYNSTLRERTAKLSSFYFHDVIESHSLITKY